MTSPDLFIIESLDPDDEGNGRFEGSTINHLLRLHGKHPEYRYVRTRSQFVKAVEEFSRSGYRYLHISAHGDRDGMSTTNQDDISNADLARILGSAFLGKRLFLSACAMVHKELAREVIPATGCSSVVGPRKDIGFTDAAVFWPALYHLMFRQDSERMTRASLVANLTKVATLFDVEIGYYSRSPSAKGFTRNILRA